MPQRLPPESAPAAAREARRWQQLLRQACQSDEPFSAAALFATASPVERSELAERAFATRRRRLMLAAAPFLAPAVLDWLGSQASDEALRLRLARNPATPSATLAQLWSGDARPARLALLLARHRNTPQPVLADIAEQVSEVEILRALCENAGADPELLDSVRERHVGVFRRVLAVNQATRASTLLAMWQESAEEAVRMQILLHPHCPESLLTSIAHPPLLRRALAQQPRTPAPLLAELARDPDAPVRRAAVANAHTAMATLEHAAADCDVGVRRVLAARRDLPAMLAVRLAADEDEWVRRNLARNPACPAALLQQLARDPASEVRRSVARHPQCPRELLELLAADPEPWVQAGVAYRDDLRPALLRRLAISSDVDVLAGVARSSAAAVRLLRRLAGHESADVRRAVILNPATPLPVLRMLSRDPYPLHRAMVVEHPNFSPAARWRMRADPDVQVRYRVLAGIARRMAQALSPGSAPIAIDPQPKNSSNEEEETT